MVWQSDGQDGSGWGIFGRRFTSQGIALGGEIAITGTPAGDQRSPAVARQPSGAFLVTWQSESTSPDGSSWGVFARGFDASGNAVSPEYLVNATVEFTAGLNRANNSIMGLSRDGLGTITALASSQIHLILDVNGYFE